MGNKVVSGIKSFFCDLLKNVFTAPFKGKDDKEVKK